MVAGVVAANPDRRDDRPHQGKHGLGVSVRQETERPVDRSDRGRDPARRGWLLRPPTLAGAAVALLFWWWSLDPSMLPRSWYAQGAVSGLSAAIGYLLGTLIGAGVRWVLRRLGREPTPGARRRARLALGVAGAVVVVAAWPCGRAGRTSSATWSAWSRSRRRPWGRWRR
jgi:uncharacterized membrane protein